MSTPDDLSLRSIQPPPEFSLGSLGSSSFLSSSEGEGDRRVPPFSRSKFSTSVSNASPTTAASSAPVATPSPPRVVNAQRKSSELLATPMAKRPTQGTASESDEAPHGLPSDDPNPSKFGKPRNHTEKAPTSLTLREQEKTIDQLNKKIWSLQLKIHYLEERLDQSQPETHQVIAKQNVALKIEVHTLETELKKTKKLTLRLEKELESLGASADREKELEQLLADRERELREMRKNRNGHMDPDESLQALQQAEERVMDLEDHAEALETELDTARRQLEENIHEIDKLHEALQERPDGPRMTDLSDRNDELRERLADTEDALARREEEREELLDENEGLRLQLEDMQRRREAEAAERSASRAALYESQEEHDVMESEINGLRDRLARAALDLEMREEELDQKQREVEDVVEQFREQVEANDDEWRGELEEQRAQTEELRTVLDEKEAEARELRVQLTDMEESTHELHHKFESALLVVEEETKEKEAELEAANREIQRLGDRVFELEDASERSRETQELWKEEVMAETARLEGTVVALKEKLSTSKAELQSTTDAYQQCKDQIVAHRQRQEELAKHVNDIVEELDLARKEQQKIKREYDAAVRKHEDDLRKEKRSLDQKEATLQSALDQLNKAHVDLDNLEKDYDDIQKAHKDAQTRGDTHSADFVALQLQSDRLERDVQRLEDDLRRCRADLDNKVDKIRDKETIIDNLHIENRELSGQLATQTQARLNIAEKLDHAQRSLKNHESDLQTFRGKLNETESALSKSQRGAAGTESQFRDQLTERNTLLLTVYQYLDKIVGVDKTTKKGSSAEVKPFSNFTAFHDNLVTRLKSLSHVQADFDRRSKDAETRYSDRLENIKKQLDARWRQLDKFEASVSKIAEQKAAWRRKFHEKDSELEISKTAQADLSAQLSILRRAPQSDTTGMKAMTARAVNAEKRLNNVQNQLLATEEKMISMKDKIGSADSKWEARVREYESRIRACEEKVKRERQGAKERVADLETANKMLQKQYDVTVKRIQQLQDMLEQGERVAGGSGGKGK